MALVLLATSSLTAQTTLPTSAQYLGQEPPGQVPVVFAPGIVSTTELYEYGSVFSPDGKEFFYAVTINSKPQIRCIKFEKNGWSKPMTIIGSDKFEYNDPFLSPDGNRLYFISDQPAPGRGEKKNFDIWYLERKGNSWSKAPINAGPGINSAQNEYFISFTNEGTMYFSSNAETSPANERNYNVRFSRSLKGRFQPSQKLGNAVNTGHYEADVFVSPDERYLIFCAERPDGYGQGDLYISFKSPTGDWEKAKNLGDAINTPSYEFCPFVSGNGKYLFFSRDGDIHWVKATFLDTLK